MESLVHILLSNAVVATLMAAMVAAVSRICRRPALTHSLWLVVMLKLVTPPLVPVSLPVANIFSAIGSSPAIAHVDHAALSWPHSLNRWWNVMSTKARRAAF